MGKISHWKLRIIGLYFLAQKERKKKKRKKGGDSESKKLVASNELAKLVIIVGMILFCIPSSKKNILFLYIKVLFA